MEIKPAYISKFRPLAFRLILLPLIYIIASLCVLTIVIGTFSLQLILINFALGIFILIVLANSSFTELVIDKDNISIIYPYRLFGKYSCFKKNVINAIIMNESSEGRFFQRTFFVELKLVSEIDHRLEKRRITTLFTKTQWAELFLMLKEAGYTAIYSKF